MNSQYLDGSLLAGTPGEQRHDVRTAAGRKASALNLAKSLSVYFGVLAVDLGMWYGIWKVGRWAYHLLTT